MFLCAFVKAHVESLFFSFLVPFPSLTLSFPHPFLPYPFLPSPFPPLPFPSLTLSFLTLSFPHPFLPSLFPSLTLSFPHPFLPSLTLSFPHPFLPSLTLLLFPSFHRDVSRELMLFNSRELQWRLLPDHRKSLQHKQVYTWRKH